MSRRITTGLVCMVRASCSEVTGPSASARWSRACSTPDSRLSLVMQHCELHDWVRADARALGPCGWRGFQRRGPPQRSGSSGSAMPGGSPAMAAVQPATSLAFIVLTGPRRGSW